MKTAKAKRLKKHRASCERKLRYSQLRALTVAAQMRAKGLRVVGYKCAACGTWHVGHKPIRKPRKVRA